MFVKRLLKGSEGFTLVEMTVVIAIIAVLAALALPAVTGITTTTRGASKAGDQKETQQAVVRYEDANGGSLPSSTNTLDSDFTAALTFADNNNDGTLNILIDNTGVATAGVTPTVDVTCVGADVDAALLTCLGALDFSLMVPTYLSNNPQHTADYVSATIANSHATPDLAGDADITTIDFTIDNCDLAGSTCNFYLDNGDALTNLFVWNVNKNNSVFSFKRDDSYGQ